MLRLPRLWPEGTPRFHSQWPLAQALALSAPPAHREPGGALPLPQSVPPPPPYHLAVNRLGFIFSPVFNKFVSCYLPDLLIHQMVGMNFWATGCFGQAVKQKQVNEPKSPPSAHPQTFLPGEPRWPFLPLPLTCWCSRILPHVFHPALQLCCVAALHATGRCVDFYSLIRCHPADLFVESSVEKSNC